MKSTHIIASLSLVLGAITAHAQTITGFGSNENFAIQNATFTTATLGTTSTQIIGVEGSELNGTLPVPADASLFATRNLVLTGTFTGANPGSGFGIELLDANFESISYSGSWSSFTSGTPGSVTLTFGANTGAFDGTVVRIAITTAGPSSALNFTFDNLSLNPTVVPEPSTYASIAGLAVLGFVAYRRRRVAA